MFPVWLQAAIAAAVCVAALIDEIRAARESRRSAAAVRRILAYTEKRS